MPLFDNKKTTKKSLRDIPEGTTKKEKPKNGVVQWIKNSGHSVKGVFLEWLSEQQLFTVVNDEIKMIKQEQKKKKMSPQEKKTFKQKVAALSDDAIKKFGELYLGTNSSQEAKDKIKEGIQTVLGQIKSGNFYHKANAFGDDEFDAFMDDLEDEWEEDQQASGEVFMLNDIINKHGFGEFMSRSWVDQHIQEDVVDKDGEEITILVKLPDKQKEPTEEQKASLEQLKKQAVRNAINQKLKNSLSEEISEMNDGNLTYSYYRIMEYTIFPNNEIEGAVYTQFKDKSGTMGSETNEYKYVPVIIPKISKESYINNILHKHGFGEMVNISKYNVSTKSIGEKAKLDKIIYKSGFGEFMKPGKPKFQQEDIDDVDGSNLSVFLYFPKGETEINDLQKSILEDLKDPKERDKINKDAKNQLTKRGALLDDEEYTIKYDKIASFEISPDGIITGTAYGWFTNKANPNGKPTYDEIGYDVEITRYEKKKPQGEFMKPENKNTISWDLDIENGESLEVEFTLSKNQTEPNELQKKIFEKLKDPKVRKELNDYARSKSSTISDDGESKIKFAKIHYFKIRQDGMMFVDTSGYYISESPTFNKYYDEIDHMVPISIYKEGK